MKRLLAVPLALILIGCATPPENGSTTSTGGGELTERTITLQDGRVIPCVYWTDGISDQKVGGIDCDWHPER